MPDVFVYGARMSGGPGYENGRAASLKGYDVRFVAEGLRFLEPAFAALVRDKLAVAHGVLFEVNSDTWLEMLQQEHGYDSQQLEVRCGTEHRSAQVLILQEKYLLPKERTPSARYLQLLLSGAKQYGLPQKQCENLTRLLSEAPQLSRYLSGLKGPVLWLTPYLGFRASVALLIFVLLGAFAFALALIL